MSAQGWPPRVADAWLADDLSHQRSPYSYQRLYSSKHPKQPVCRAPWTSCSRRANRLTRSAPSSPRRRRLSLAAPSGGAVPEPTTARSTCDAATNRTAQCRPCTSWTPCSWPARQVGAARERVVRRPSSSVSSRQCRRLDLKPATRTTPNTTRHQPGTDHPSLACHHRRRAGERVVMSWCHDDHGDCQPQPNLKMNHHYWRVPVHNKQATTNGPAAALPADRQGC